MKFGKSLSNQIEGAFPEWRDMFISYKELKKRLKMIEQPEEGRPSKRARLDDGYGGGMSIEQIDFVELLEAEVEKFNGFFEEKCEDYVIKFKEFEDSITEAKGSSEELMKIGKEFVDFHGEMVLLENYSAFNYTGLVKILKKYDKRTGACMRLPFLQKVVQQPFFTLDLLYKLIKKCESMLDNLFPMCEPAVPSTSAVEGRETVQQVQTEYIESLYMKSVVSALRILQEIRSGSSTVSAYSLPPLQSSVLEETWNKIPILAQVAK